MAPQRPTFRLLATTVGISQLFGNARAIASCNLRDLRAWQRLPAEPDGQLLANYARILKTCGVIFLRPEHPATTVLQDLHSAALHTFQCELGGMGRDEGQAGTGCGHSMVFVDGGNKKPTAAFNSGPLRGERVAWISAPDLESNGNASLALLLGAGRVVRAARTQAVALDFFTVLAVPQGAPAQDFHSDAGDDFVKLQLAMHAHADPDGAIIFLAPNVSIANASSSCGVPSGAPTEGAEGAEACARVGTDVVGLPGGAAAAGDMILYMASARHAGLQNIGHATKLVLDISFGRGSSGYIHHNWDPGLAYAWNRRWRRRWAMLAHPWGEFEERFPINGLDSP